MTRGAHPQAHSGFGGSWFVPRFAAGTEASGNHTAGPELPRLRFGSAPPPAFGSRCGSPSGRVCVSPLLLWRAPTGPLCGLPLQPGRSQPFPRLAGEERSGCDSPTVRRPGRGSRNKTSPRPQVRGRLCRRSLAQELPSLISAFHLPPPLSFLFLSHSSPLLLPVTFKDSQLRHVPGTSGCRAWPSPKGRSRMKCALGSC